MTASLPASLGSFSWHFLKKYWFCLLLIQFFSFAWSVDHTLWPYVIMVLIDTITTFTGDKADAWQVLATPIAMGISLWIGVDLSFRLAWCISAWLFPRLEASIRMGMFDYVLNHSYHYFSSHMAGAIANKISDMPLAMTRLLLLILSLFVPVAAALLISTVLFAQINPLFAAILVGWVCLHMGVCLWFAPKCDALSHVHAESRSLLSGKIVDALSNTAAVRLFSRNRFESEYLSRFQSDEMKKNQTGLLYIEKMKMLLGLTSFLGVGIGLNGWMLYQWQQGHLSAGEVVFIFNTSWNITMMTWIASIELPSLFKEIGICRQALSIIQTQHEIVDAPKALPLIVKRGKISFEHVTFHYSKHQNLFEQKTLTIQAGQKVGLVGYSGSGKSSFVHLILRYYDIQGGVILIDGQDISKVTQESLRQQIAMIPQEPVLFHRTLMENIRYGRISATDEEVVAAAKQANCHEFIMKLPEKYETMAGERGVKLSGGQKQRIAIARSILKDAPIIILDEATSALDSVTELEIQQALHRLTKDKTTLIIAHRLSTLAHMDRILVFKEGKVVEDGAHQQLLNLKGHYAFLWNTQINGFLFDSNGEDETDSELESSTDFF